MGDGYFREILGVAHDAPRDEIRRAYRRRVMENHPDRFPPEKKELQELATMTLTEAYDALMASTVPADARAADLATDPKTRPTETGVQPHPPSDALGPHRDHAYAFYKQGFINFSLALHGVAEINRRLATGRVDRPRRYSAAEDITASLAYLRAAHGYFTRVIEQHGESVWIADARMKLRRIERFTAIYRRILANIASRPAARPEPRGAHDPR
jgi:curved DNA-binding protein CbpA